MGGVGGVGVGVDEEDRDSVFEGCGEWEDAAAAVATAAI